MELLQKLNRYFVRVLKVLVYRSEKNYHLQHETNVHEGVRRIGMLASFVPTWLKLESSHSRKQLRNCLYKNRP